MVIATEWPEFQELDWALVHATMATPLVIDGRRILDPDAMRDRGFRYERVGSPAPSRVLSDGDSGVTVRPVLPICGKVKAHSGTDAIDGVRTVVDEDDARMDQPEVMSNADALDLIRRSAAPARRRRRRLRADGVRGSPTSRTRRADTTLGPCGWHAPQGGRL